MSPDQKQAPDPEKIKKQAKQIMDEFMKALDKIGQDNPHFGIERESQTRTPRKTDYPAFRSKMFKNAPKKNSDYIITERKKW